MAVLHCLACLATFIINNNNNEGDKSEQERHGVITQGVADLKRELQRLGYICLRSCGQFISDGYS